MKKIISILLFINVFAIGNAQNIHKLLRAYEWKRGESIYLFISRQDLYDNGNDEEERMCRRLKASGIILGFSGQTGRDHNMPAFQHYYALDGKNLSVLVEGEGWHNYTFSNISKNGTIKFKYIKKNQDDFGISMILEPIKKRK
ncbi:MAG: hypothetical protein ABR936_15170 [Bacteroidota bacterium]|jgi:hypothetical protein